MKILDENDVEIPESEIDEEKGYTTQERKLVKHHDAIPATQAESHYEVTKFFFKDGTSMEVTSQDDPHIGWKDKDHGVAEYIDQGEGKTVRGISLITVIDKESEPEKPAWDEYEDFLRWHPYTEEEIQARKDQKEQEEKKEVFLSNGPIELEQLQQQMQQSNETISNHDIRINDTEIEVGDLSVAFVELMESL